MSNQRQIPFLHWTTRADGTVMADWKPSPRLRKLGWRNHRIGSEQELGRKAIINAAMDLNEELEKWEEQRRNGCGLAAAAPIPVVWTFADLVDAFQAQTNSDWTQLRPASQREYGVRLRQLRDWAQDDKGQSIPATALDQQMVADLKDALMPVSVFRAAATLRVLRRLLRWGSQPSRRYVKFDATKGVQIPTTTARQQKLTWEQVQAVAQMAEEQGNPTAARAARIAFWCLQRRADVAELNAMSWRTLESLDPMDRPVLAGNRGEVRAFRVFQKKTGVWVDCPMPPALHGEIESAFAAGQWLLPDDGNPDAAMPDWKIQRQLRPAFDAAGFPDHQLRDLRRSGMSWFKDMGALQSNIFAISGHAVLGKRTIIDTYMPPDTRAACAAIAAVLRTQADIEARKREHG